MRLRHIKGAREFLEANNEFVITDITSFDIFNVFNSSQPIHLEVGCGKGKFIIDMAKTFKDINFIAVEKYDSVLLRAVEKYLDLEDKPLNLRFILADFNDLAQKITQHSINTLYLNFSDPWPKARQAKRRLTSPIFLNLYKNILTKDGYIIQKTDNIDLFNYSLLQYELAGFKIISKTYDLHSTNIFNITTEYEDKWSIKGPICYAKVSL